MVRVQRRVVKNMEDVEWGGRWRVEGKRWSKYRETRKFFSMKKELKYENRA